MGSTAEEPMVRGLCAGGRWIRTIGPPVTCELCWRGLSLLPARERERFSLAFSAPRTTPSSRAGARFEQVVACCARGGFRHLAVQLIYTFALHGSTNNSVNAHTKASQNRRASGSHRQDYR